MNILFYSIAFSSIKNIEKLYLKLTEQKSDVSFLLIDHSENKIDISIIKKLFPKIVIISQQNTGYSGAFNVAINFAIKNSFTHLIHINDDVDLMENTIENLINNSYFQESVITGCEYNSKNEIVSYGSKMNFISGKLFWNKIMDTRVFSSFSNQGALFSIPIKRFNNFKLPNLFMYCEELYMGFFMKNNGIKCYALGNVKYIHRGAVVDNELSNFKIYYITRNNYIVFKEMTKNYYYLYIYFYFTLRGLTNFIYRTFQFKFKYSKYLFIGLLHGMLNRSGKYDFKK